MQHVMIDLETLGTSNDSVILSLGAVKFDPNGVGHEDALYMAIDPTSCLAYNLTVDGETLKWWFDPDRDEARHKLMGDTMLDLPTALDAFSRWFGYTSVPVWGNGSTFDNVILRSAFKAIGYECPWKFWHDRCFRTIKSLPGAQLVQTPRVGTGHHALDDAIWQAQHLQHIVAEMTLAI